MYSRMARRGAGLLSVSEAFPMLLSVSEHTELQCYHVPLNTFVQSEYIFSMWINYLFPCVRSLSDRRETVFNTGLSQGRGCIHSLIQRGKLMFSLLTFHYTFSVFWLIDLHLFLSVILFFLIRKVQNVLWFIQEFNGIAFLNNPKFLERISENLKYICIKVLF